MAALDRKDVKKANKSMLASKENIEISKEKIADEKLSEKTKDLSAKESEVKENDEKDKEEKEKQREKEKEEREERERKEKEEARRGKDKVKRKLDQSGGPVKKLGRPRKEDREKTSLVPMPVTPVRVTENEAVVEKSSVDAVSILFPALRINKSHTIQQTTHSGLESPMTLEIENDVTSGVHTFHHLRAQKNDQLVWDLVFSARIAAVCANRSVVCVACEDRTLSLLSTSGRRLCPKLALGAPAATIKINAHFVLVITTRGDLSIWDTRSMKAVIRNENLSAIMPDKGLRLESAQLTEKAVPILCLTDGKSYSYNLDLQAWFVIGDSGDGMAVCSDHHQCAPPGGQFKHKGFLASLQGSRQSGGQGASKLFSSGHPLKRSVTLSHLDAQVAACTALQSRDEYHFWLLTYVRYLVQEGHEGRLRDVCQELLGPMYASKSSSWQPEILGYKKQDLLREILPLIGSNLGFQRLFTEYSEQLDSLTTS